MLNCDPAVGWGLVPRAGGNAYSSPPSCFLVSGCKYRMELMVSDNDERFIIFKTCTIVTTAEVGRKVFFDNKVYFSVLV